jgi:pilus assembly protein Flp/PilA
MGSRLEWRATHSLWYSGAEARLRFLKAYALMVFSEPDGSARMIATLIMLWKEEDGATAIEYGLIAALIAVAAIGAMQLVGTSLTKTFTTVATKL